ncbi:polyamine aminopropyltransferase [Actinomadura algeriensis]|uniref:Spermidine synthase n=1 Tax=Actinomadura algeriensis TaxID=1679523 RepID=A0ABR9JYD3_9ACTN|nr:spermidine synthase [Actinomadura algeriensis]MBE1535594.1 spermidine synthase [Actinomadura algeriensis]
MGALFEELDWRPTPMGVVSLRRRRDPALGAEVYEIKLDDDFLMSSLWTVGEIELARLGLAALQDMAPEGGMDVIVGGLGLGHTAHAALEDPRVRSLVVVEKLGEVIEWHRAGLVPLGEGLADDARCRLVQGDFFAMAGSRSGFDSVAPGGRVHAVLLDIDHSPQHVLDSGHAAFYRPEPLTRLAEQIHPGGVFALWSNDPPDDGFTSLLGELFTEVTAHVVEFPNHIQGGTATNTVYVARTPAENPRP